MKRTLLPPTKYFGSRVGAALLALSLIAGPGLAAPAAAVEPTPTAPAAATGDTTAPPAPTATPALATATAAPTPSASSAPLTVDNSTEAYRSAMAEATKTGGAEMGQGTRAAAASLNGDKAAGTEALATEGTWMPSFGVQGLDVSKYQSGINWQTQWNMGARFAYVKATEGNYYTSTTFGDQYQGSRAVGMIRGAYHFANPAASSGADQARIFVQNGGGWSADGYTLPPVLDFEGNPYAGQTIGGYYQGNTCYDMSPSQLTAWARDFGNTMKALTGRLPVMYTTTTWWNYCTGGASGFGDWPLWIARWPSSPSDSPGALPSSWGNFSLWQYSESGPFAGGGDSNVWNGTYASLQSFAGKPVPAVPAGSFDSLTVSRTDASVALNLQGWAVDMANTATATEAHAYVTAPDGTRTGYVIPANGYRPDVDRALGIGANHGYQKSINLQRSGTYQVCLFAIGGFANTSLGCKSASVTGVEAPIGSLDEFREIRTATTSVLSVRGWTVDMSGPLRSTEAHAYVTAPNGVRTGYNLPANISRPDVNSALGVSGNHGYQTNIPVTQPGTYSVCVYAIGLNRNTQVGCQQVTVKPAGEATGYLDNVALSKSSSAAIIRATGWTFDSADSTRSIPVHIYVTSPNGVSKGYAFTAATARTDVNSALGISGKHGYSTEITATEPGIHTVCAFGISIHPAASGNPLLGCRKIDVGSPGKPIGYLDRAALSTSGGVTSLVAAGWTLDPDVPAVSNEVHTYVTAPNGITTGYPSRTNRLRTDVNVLLGTSGNHGYSVSVPVSLRGRYTVCTYGIGASPFSLGNTLLGCQTVQY